MWFSLAEERVADSLQTCFSILAIQCLPKPAENIVAPSARARERCIRKCGGHRAGIRWDCDRTAYGTWRKTIPNFRSRSRSTLQSRYAPTPAYVWPAPCEDE